MGDCPGSLIFILAGSWMNGALQANGSWVVTPVGRTTKSRPSIPRTISTRHGGKAVPSSWIMRSFLISFRASSVKSSSAERIIRYLAPGALDADIHSDPSTGPLPRDSHRISLSLSRRQRMLLKNRSEVGLSLHSSRLLSSSCCTCLVLDYNADFGAAIGRSGRLRPCRFGKPFLPKSYRERGRN